MPDALHAKLDLIHEIEEILKVRYQGKNERDADIFLEKHYFAYIYDRERIFRHTSEPVKY